MLTKLAKAFSLLRQEVTTLKGDVQRIEKVRQVVQHGRDGVSPDPDEIVSAVLEKIPAPKDGVSPDPQAVAEAAAKLIPEPKPGRDAVPPSVRDVADVVLAKIEKPKDGVSPDPKAIAEAAAKLLPVPKDGVSPTAEEVAKKMPNPQRGKTGAPGKNGVSVTDVQLNNNELFVFLDGKKKKAGKIKMPAASAPFNPGNAGGGGSARGAAPEVEPLVGFIAFSDDDFTLSQDPDAPSFLPGLTLSATGWELFDGATGAVRNVSGEAQTSDGLVSFNPNKLIGGGTAVVYVFSETSIDAGASFQINAGSLRPVEISNSSESFKSAVSFIIETPAGGIVRFRAYSVGNMAFESSSQTVLGGQTVTGHSVIWNLSKNNG